MPSFLEMLPLLNPRPLNGILERTKNHGVQLLGVCYSILLCWQIVGVSLFAVRCVTCYEKQILTFKCDKDAPFRHSKVLQLVWLVTQCLHGAILIAALQKVPAFPGYKAILHRLKFLPSFWTLIVLIIILLSRFVSLSFSSESSLQMLIMIVFSVSYVVKILLMGFFNYTQLKMLKNNYPKFVFVLSKLALFVFVVECLVSFAMSFLSMLLRVEEIPNLGKGEKLGVMRTSDILRQVSVAFFRLKILSFFWQKLFVDDKNILSNFENLPNWAIVVWRGTRISNSNNVNDAREGKKKRKEMSREKAKYLLIHIVGLGCSPSDPLPDKHANQIIYYQDRNISFQHQKQCDHISFFSCTRVK